MFSDVETFGIDKAVVYASEQEALLVATKELNVQPKNFVLISAPSGECANDKLCASWFVDNGFNHATAQWRGQIQGLDNLMVGFEQIFDGVDVSVSQELPDDII